MAVGTEMKRSQHENINKKKEIPRLLKQHGLYNDMADTQQHRNKCSKKKKEYVKDYARQKCKMEHSTKKLYKVCTQDHKQNAKILKMRMLLYGKYTTTPEEIPPPKEYMRYVMRKKCDMQHSVKTS